MLEYNRNARKRKCWNNVEMHAKVSNKVMDLLGKNAGVQQKCTQAKCWNTVEMHYWNTVLQAKKYWNTVEMHYNALAKYWSTVEMHAKVFKKIMTLRGQNAGVQQKCTQKEVLEQCRNARKNVEESNDFTR